LFAKALNEWASPSRVPEFESLFPELRIGTYANDQLSDISVIPNKLLMAYFAQGPKSMEPGNQWNGT
jgi:hypothetical protein